MPYDTNKTERVHAQRFNNLLTIKVFALLLLTSSPSIGGSMDRAYGYAEKAGDTVKLEGKITDKKPEGLIVLAYKIGAKAIPFSRVEIYVLVINSPNEAKLFIDDYFMGTVTLTDKTYELQKGYQPIQVFAAKAK